MLETAVSKPILLVLFCAAAYALATLAMKLSAGGASFALYAAIAVCLGAAVVVEIAVLRRMDLGPAYIAILGTETLIVVAIAAAIGEGLGARELVGAALVLGGTALIGA